MISFINPIKGVAKLIKFFIFIEYFLRFKKQFWEREVINFDMTYCDYITTITGDQLSLHKEYHDNHYGFPIENDDELFERLKINYERIKILKQNK